jgi:hypothetical protein
MTISRNDKLAFDIEVVYIFKFDLAYNDSIYKIGITTRDDIHKRFAEVMIAFYKQFRYVPSCSIRRFTTTERAKECEAELLKLGTPVNFQKNFSGYTEFRYVDEVKLLEAYDRIVKGIE